MENGSLVCLTLFLAAGGQMEACEIQKDPGKVAGSVKSPDLF